MAAMTRIDARSAKNNAIQIKDLDGNIICTIEAMPNPHAGLSEDSLRNEVNLRIHSSDKIVVVKSNGAILRKR